MSGEESSERREAQRIPAELRVEFRHLGRPKAPTGELSRDISSGGLFVATSVGLPLGTRVELEISPGPSAKPIRVRAEVVRVEEEPGVTGSRATMRTKGMALRFVEVDPNDVTRLLSLAKELQARESK